MDKELNDCFSGVKELCKIIEDYIGYNGYYVECMGQFNFIEWEALVNTKNEIVNLLLTEENDLRYYMYNISRIDESQFIETYYEGYEIESLAIKEKKELELNLQNIPEIKGNFPQSSKKTKFRILYPKGSLSSSFQICYGQKEKI